MGTVVSEQWVLREERNGCSVGRCFMLISVDIKYIYVDIKYICWYKKSFIKTSKAKKTHDARNPKNSSNRAKVFA